MVLLLMSNVIIIIIESKCDIEIVWCLKKDAWEKIDNEMYQHIFMLMTGVEFCCAWF